MTAATITSKSNNDKFEYISYTNQLYRHIANIAKVNKIILNNFEDVLKIYHNINENDKFYFDMIKKIKLNFKDFNLEETLKNIFEEHKALKQFKENNNDLNEVFKKYFPEDYERISKIPQEVFDKEDEERMKAIEKLIGGKIEFDHWIEAPNS